MFLIEKYRPINNNQLLFNQDIFSQLAHLGSYEDIPHIIISGPSGGGKKTLVKFFLEMIYDQSVNNVTKRKYVISGSSAKKEVEILQSDHHIVIEPTKSNYDKYMLQEIIRQYSIYRTFDIFDCKRTFKTIVINNIENLANNSQSALRRTMELYAKRCRFIMICNNLSKIIDPLRSRCRIFCVGLPSISTVNTVIDNIAICEGMIIKKETRERMIEYSNNNIKKAIWFLECRRLKLEGTITLDEIFVRIVDDILRTPTTKDIVQLFANKIRPNIYNTLITNIHGTDIIITIMDQLIKRIDDDEIALKIIRFASDAEFNHIQGRREIKHIDFFVSNVMYELRKKAESEAKKAKTATKAKTAKTVKTVKTVKTAKTAKTA